MDQRSDCSPPPHRTGPRCLNMGSPREKLHQVEHWCICAFERIMLCYWGVLRDNSSKFKCIFSSPIPFMEINCAEILAIHRAIRISSSWDLSSYEEVIFESDSSNAVLWCNSESGGPWNMNFHLNFIRNVRMKHPNISIIHKSRKSNFVADALAKQGLHRQSEFIAWM